MAWENRGNGRKYFYVSVRRDGKKVKYFLGNGEKAHAAASATEVRENAKRERRRIRESFDASMAPAEECSRNFRREARLLVEAFMFALGFHRSNRHFWRIWLLGRDVLDLSRR